MYVTCGIYALSLHSALLQIPVNVRQARRLAPGALQSAVGGWSRVVRAQGTHRHRPHTQKLTEHPKKDSRTQDKDSLQSKHCTLQSFIAFWDFHGIHILKILRCWLFDCVAQALGVLWVESTSRPQ